jgi:L-fucose isomerase-like protein
MKDIKIGFVPIARVNFDMELAENTTRRFRENLEINGLRVIGGEQMITDQHMAKSAIDRLSKEDLDLLLVFQSTFADSTMITEIAEGTESPIFLWAVPEAPTGGRLRLNSLCGINLAAHALKLRGVPYEYAYADIDNVDAYKKVKAVAAAEAVEKRLRRATLGVVGEHPAGMDTCRLDTSGLGAKLGVGVQTIDLETVFKGVRSLDPNEILPVREKLNAVLENLDELEQAPLNGTLGAYLVLKQLAGQNKLDGIAVRCWPEFFTDLGCAACGAISMLTDEGIPCSCEADANGTITQLILYWLSDSPAFGTDIVSVDIERDYFIVWHCGLAPLSYADPEFKPRGTIHSNRKLPLLMEFPLQPGVVTIARLSQSSGELGLVVGTGEMLSGPINFSGTSGILRFKRPASQVLDTILSEGLEHHVAVTYGDHSLALKKLAQRLDLPILEL